MKLLQKGRLLAYLSVLVLLSNLLYFSNPLSQKWNPTIAFTYCGIYTTPHFTLHVTPLPIPLLRSSECFYFLDVSSGLFKLSECVRRA
jgi:hypothetical protein